MVVFEFPRNFTVITVIAIDWYQEYLSPRKGFYCAHRVLHGNNSCSEWIKRLIIRVGIFRAIPLAIRRFRSCSDAYKMLSQHYSENKVAKNDNEKKEFKECPCANKNNAVCCDIIVLPCYLS